MELQENTESIEDKIVYLKRCRKSLNDLTAETRDAQYVREFHETGNKYNMLKTLYDRDKLRLSLVSLKSYPIAQDIINMDVLGGVITMKRCISLAYVPKRKIKKKIKKIVRYSADQT